ncbi:MAG: YqjK-like family protein [Candidatus Accumulibacter sp.]|jgi:hypothetical protein|nr:YqjK-like family protein [Accumulibacter sp.]
MSRPRDDLLLRRGRLIERIAQQRAELRRDFRPVTSALGKVDVAVAGIRWGADSLLRHPLVTSVVAGVFLIFKGKASLHWAGRAYSLWRSWYTVRSIFFGGRDR